MKMTEESTLQGILKIGELELRIRDVCVHQLNPRTDKSISFKFTNDSRKKLEKVDLRYFDIVDVYIGNDTNPSSDEFEEYMYCGSMNVGLDEQPTHSAKRNKNGR